MCLIRLLTFGFTLFSMMLANASDGSAVLTEKDLYEECSAYSQAGMRDCLAIKAIESEKTLRQAEEEVGNFLSKWDEDKKYIGLAKAKLAASSREFSSYREAQCAFSASLSGGGAGNAHEMGRLACVTELNNRRAVHLRNAVADLPLK